MNQSENAIMAKVRSLYGKGLKREDYEQLLTKKTVAEAAGYLKNQTCYRDTLGEIKEELVHRGQLESLIHRRTLDVCSRLMKYTGRDTLFLRLFVMQNEIRQLLTVIRLFNSGRPDRYIVSLPVRLARLLSYDLYAMTHIRTFDDLLEALDHSPYQRIVGQFRPTGVHRIIDITSCEAALFSYYFETALSLVDRDYTGQARKDLRRLFAFQMASHNTSVILRMRRYLHAPPEMIRPRVVEVRGLPSRLIQKLLDAPDLDACHRLVNRAPLLRKHPVDWEQNPRQLSLRMAEAKRDMTRKLFRYSTHPEVVVMAYLVLLEVEQSNIIHIIEGIRYNVNPQDLRQMVCL